jgi:hypothetical protein
MGQAAERVEEHLRPAPGGGARRDVEQHFPLDPAEASVDMGLLGELFFEEAYPQARQSSFQGVELKYEFHASKGAAAGRGPQSGGLVDRFGKMPRP